MMEKLRRFFNHGSMSPIWLWPYGHDQGFYSLMQTGREEGRDSWGLIGGLPFEWGYPNSWIVYNRQSNYSMDHDWGYPYLGNLHIMINIPQLALCGIEFLLVYSVI